MSVSDTLGSAARRYGSMIGVGLIGVLGLAVATWWQLRLAANLKPTVVGSVVVRQIAAPAALVAVAAIVGGLVNDQLALRSHVYEWAREGSTDRPSGDTLIAAAGVGVSIGLGLFVGNTVMGQTVAGEAASLGTLAVVVPARLLYLGLTEEILLRWGLLSAIAYLGLRWFAATDAPSRRYVLWGAIVVTALAIPVGRLAVTQEPVAGGLPGVFWILAANAVPGIAFGWLFWKRSLEVAMVAHVATHLPLIVGSVVLL